MNQRVGLGYDIHRLEAAPDHHVVLAGVRIPCDHRLIAHSDGDVVLHALCDALLGAVGAGDLGEFFPDDDPAHADRPSAAFLEEVLALPDLVGWRLINCDINIIAQTPRLGPHKPAMRRHLRELLGLGADRVGLKARSHENLDAIGERRAIAAQAVVLLEMRTGTGERGP